MQYDRGNIQAAFDATQKGMTVYKAARLFGISDTTLRDRVKGIVEVDAKPGFVNMFSEKEEENLVQYIMQMNKSGKYYTAISIRTLAKDYAQLLGKDVKATKLLSNNWYYSFRQRWPDITVALAKPGHSYSQDLQEDSDTYYKKLKALLNKH